MICRGQRGRPVRFRRGAGEGRKEERGRLQEGDGRGQQVPGEDRRRRGQGRGAVRRTARAERTAGGRRVPGARGADGRHGGFLRRVPGRARRAYRQDPVEGEREPVYAGHPHDGAVRPG